MSEGSAHVIRNKIIQRYIVHQIRSKRRKLQRLKGSLCRFEEDLYRFKRRNWSTKSRGIRQEMRQKYGYISKSWRANREQLSTFWIYPDEIRTLIYTTNPIESFNRCLKKVTKNRPTFPLEEA